MPKAIVNFDDIVGNKYGELIVNKYTDTIKKGRMNYHYYDCSCNCGTTHVRVTRQCLIKGDTKSCGCLKAQRNKERMENLLGQQFGRWVVIDWANTRYSSSGKSRSSMWLCRCECGSVAEVRARALKTGHSQSCGCLQKEMVSALAVDDLTGLQFAYLNVVERNGSKTYVNPNTSRKSIRAMWLCRCDCGRTVTVTGESLKNGDTTSCGCQKSSKYEMYVEQYLESQGYVKNVDFFREKTYSDLLGVGHQHLRLDFEVHLKSGDVVLVECQGEQHYKPIDWYGGVDYFEKLQQHDALKKEFAKQKKLQLIEVPYTAVLYDNIVDILQQNNIY